MKILEEFRSIREELKSKDVRVADEAWQRFKLLSEYVRDEWRQEAENRRVEYEQKKEELEVLKNRREKSLLKEAKIEKKIEALEVEETEEYRVKVVKSEIEMVDHHKAEKLENKEEQKTENQAPKTEKFEMAGEKMIKKAETMNKKVSENRPLFCWSVKIGRMAMDARKRTNLRMWLKIKAWKKQRRRRCKKRKDAAEPGGGARWRTTMAKMKINRGFLCQRWRLRAEMKDRRRKQTPAKMKVRLRKGVFGKTGARVRCEVAYDWKKRKKIKIKNRSCSHEDERIHVGG